MADRKKVHDAVELGWTLASILEGANATLASANTSAEQNILKATADRKANADRAKAAFDKALADGTATYNMVVAGEEVKKASAQKAVDDAAALLDAHRKKSKEELNIGMDFLTPSPQQVSGGRTRI